MQRNWNTGVGDHLASGQCMVDVAVHATIGNHAHQMCCSAGRFQGIDEGRDSGIGEETAVLDGQIDLAQIHRHDPAGADIGVADF